MKLLIENVGKIKKADIFLNGLTVVAGPNDSGKSTIGKTLFTAIKSLASTRGRTLDDKAHRIINHAEKLYQRLGGSRFTSEDLAAIFPTTLEEFSRRMLQLDSTKAIDAFLNNAIKAVSAAGLTPRITSLCVSDLANIRIVLTEDAQVADVYAEVNSFIESEFLNNFCSIGSEKSVVTLLMDDEERVRFSFEVAKNQASKTAISTSRGFLEDATYVESPLYMHMLRTINGAGTFVESMPVAQRGGMLPLHVKDLAEKLYATGISIGKPETDGLISQLGLQEIMDGRFAFDPVTGNLVLIRGRQAYPAVNVASGLKTFGVLRMLLEGGMLGPNKMLIWDEPENHLHPEWQLSFAEALVLLSKAGYPLVVSTHSPYFLQSIRYYAAQYHQERFVEYYMSDQDGENSNLQVFRRVTHDLNDVFITLAEPLNRVMNVDEMRLKSNGK